MNELKIFENEKFGKLRMVKLENIPYFVAVDVCNILGLSNVTKSVERLDKDEKAKLNLGLSGGYTNCVNEYGLYNLILASRKKEAKEFKRWITHEVLPSIRKHGAYMTDETLEKALTSPDFLIKLATELKIEKEKRIELENVVEEQKPKVLFANAVETSNTSILIGEFAKILKQNGIDIGRNRLFDILKKKNFLQKRGSSKNMPTQKSMELGLFEIKESTLVNPDGSIRITRTPKITGKGQVYFMNKFLA